MNQNQHLALIGSGASAIYVLQHLFDHIGILGQHLGEISIFEKSHIMGMGMPYSPLNSDRYHMSNIYSEELPELDQSFAQWLAEQDQEFLRSLGMENEIIDESEVYSRLALGRYFNVQYQVLIGKLRATGLQVNERPSCEVIDIIESEQDDTFKLVQVEGALEGYHRIIIATGHRWPEEDRPDCGYYASPWPIFKLLPTEGNYHNFVIGTLGASLSAFDVVSSLAHRHGVFSEGPKKWSFTPHPGAENFKIIMHAASGMLPHLQFAQVNPMRKIYRHVDRESMLALVDHSGFLRLEHFYEQVCRPALKAAFQKDGMGEIVEKLADPSFGLDSFIATLSAEHDYVNAFDGMREEMAEAKESVKNERPVHWKEVMDDLLYTLNYHCELMPAEDHLKLKSVVMPFLMNVIAAMPLDSANTILALYDAGKLEMVSGKATLSQQQSDSDQTFIEIDQEGKRSSSIYRMFIDCTGQKALELEQYPFPTLVENGNVRKARALFSEPDLAKDLPDEKKILLFQENGALGFYTGGVDIDAAYRLIGRDGKPHPRLHDIAFPHTSGVRPYSYGLQACSAAGKIVVRAWIEEIIAGNTTHQRVSSAIDIYEKI